MNHRPRASVVIPAYNSDRTIASCLESLRNQTFRDFEVIVVNSSAGDRTRRIVERYPEVRFEQAERRLLPQSALNRGVGLARGELLMFTAPDCRADRDWLASLVEAHDAGHQVVAGGIDIDGGGRLNVGMHLSKFSWRLGSLPTGWTDLVQTANACYSRRVWEAVGPFEGDWLSGDVLLSRRASASGWPAWFEPSATVRHRHLGSATAFLRERLERGFDGAVTRIDFGRWSRLRVGAYLAALPILPLLLTARTGREAWRAGAWFDLLVTLPLQLAGHGAWCLGEALAHARFLSTPRRT